MMDPFEAGLAFARPPGNVYAPVIDGVALGPPIETKAEPVEATGQMLSAMMEELRLQFEAFQRIRIAAEAELCEGDGKLARADLKAATDALSLIVRTIEKLDSLQRGLVEAKHASEEQFSDEAFDALIREIERQIGERKAEGRDAFDAGRATGPPPAPRE